MLFGACLSLKDPSRLQILKDCGYDYADGNFSELALASEDEYREILAGVKSVGLPVLCCNCFLGGDVSIYDEIPGVTAPMDDYLRTGAERARELGIKKVIFGSGGKRNVPEGADRETAYKRLAEFTGHAGRVLASYGMTLVIEPLCDCNIINTVDDGVRLAEDSGNPGVRTLGDLYHMVKMGEKIGVRPEFAGKLYHAHVAMPYGRVYPKDINEFDYAAFFDMMAAGGCDTFSVEARSDDFPADAPAALKVMKEAAAEMTVACN